MVELAHKFIRLEAGPQSWGLIVLPLPGFRPGLPSPEKVARIASICGAFHRGLCPFGKGAVYTLFVAGIELLLAVLCLVGLEGVFFGGCDVVVDEVGRWGLSLV